MRILIAEDEAVTRLLLEGLVMRLGHDVVSVADGGQALACLESADPPGLALLDWVMPVMNGPEVCSRLRSDPDGVRLTYLILVTARSMKADVVTGLRAGADDYVTKPFDASELAARIDVGIRVSRLERMHRSNAREAELLRERLRRAEGLLPPCAGCRSPRTDQAYWNDVAAYLADGHEVHPSCPACAAPLVRR